MQNNFNPVAQGRRATSNNQKPLISNNRFNPPPFPNTSNNAQGAISKYRSRTINRNLDSDLQNIGDNAINL
jgi:hypothetical protein